MTPQEIEELKKLAGTTTVYEYDSLPVQPPTEEPPKASKGCHRCGFHSAYKTYDGRKFCMRCNADWVEKKEEGNKP